MAKRLLLGIAAVFFFAPSLSVRAEGLVISRSLSPALALELAQLTLEACRKKGYQVAVSVVDRSGILQVTLRDQLAGPHTPETARGKAWTAVSFRTDTVTMSGVTQSGMEQSGVRFVEQVLTIGGGVPIEAQGGIVGGIGVSGAPNGTADDACARVGLDAVLEKLEF